MSRRQTDLNVCKNTSIIECHYAKLNGAKEKMSTIDELQTKTTTTQYDDNARRNKKKLFKSSQKNNKSNQRDRLFSCDFVFFFVAQTYTSGAN